VPVYQEVTILFSLTRWIETVLIRKCFMQFPIELSVSPAPRTQTSQWQSSISCTGSGTQTSLGFSAIEKHWRIRSLYRFYGVYASKIVKRCAWSTCNTESRYLRGSAISFILLHFLNPNKTEQNIPKYSTPIQMKTKTFIFWL